jgi:hypothetical protein
MKNRLNIEKVIRCFEVITIYTMTSYVPDGYIGYVLNFLFSNCILNLQIPRGIIGSWKQ